MFKLIFKIIWYLIVILSFLLTIYFLFETNGNGIENLKHLFSGGFWEGIKQFFVNIWNGIKFVCGIN